MNGVSYQTLRLAAENATPGEWCTDDYGVIADAGLNANYYIASCSGPDNRANKRFIAAANPATVLALLDELERNQQYIKRRDQENEDIALINDGSDAYIWPVNSMEPGDVPLYIGLPRIALASIPKAMTEEKAYSNVQTSWQDAKYYATGWNACREAMLHGAEPVSQTCKLNELSGNSPVTPDGWISCSERMPAQDDWILIYSKHSEYMAGQVQGEYVELCDGTLSWLGNALYWMPLPEPPQEVRQ
ncbi:ead/Ea22-like family protein [Escherichia coli]